MLQAESPTKLPCWFIALVVTLINFDDAAPNLIIVALVTSVLVA